MAQVPPPNPAIPQGNRGPTVLASCIVVYFGALLSVVLRLWARKIKHVSLGLDDWLVIAALPICTGLVILDIISVHQGLGKHLAAIGLVAAIKVFKTLTVGQVLWVIAIPFWKISILALYNRIFGNLRWIRVWTWGLAIYTLSATISFLLAICLQCIPLDAAWNPSLKPSAVCINFTVFSTVGSGLDLLSSVIMLVLPMPAVWNLHKSVSDRISLTGLFLLGSGTCVVSLVRLVELTLQSPNDPDPSYTFISIAILGTMQPCMGVICASLPTFTPLLRKALGRPSKRYYDYANAARHVQINSGPTKSGASAKGLVDGKGHLPSFGQGQYGFHVGGRESPIELEDMIRMGPGPEVPPNSNEVYVSTDIEVQVERLVGI